MILANSNSDSLKLTKSSKKKLPYTCGLCLGEFVRAYCYLHGVETHYCKKCTRINSGKRRRLWSKQEKDKVYGRVRDTMLSRHGVPNPFCLPSTKEAIFNKYGTHHPAKLDSIKEKIKAVNRKKYGVDWSLQNAEVQAKRKATNRQRYGDENVMRNPQVASKLSELLINKYDTTTASGLAALEHASSARASTCMVKYGVTSGFNRPGQRELSAKLMLERYGTTLPNRLCGKTQKAIQDWLNSLGFNFKPDRTILDGHEVDLYEPSVKLGVEYCGLYWHNENSPSPRTRHYHHDKFLGCSKKGVRLITIFEDEWILRQSQVKGFLSSVLGKSVKINGRDCSVDLLDSQAACEFIDKHHIQSTGLGLRNCVGLIHPSEGLVGVMSFSRHPRKSKVVVLDRLCFKSGLSVRGGASKMFKFAVNALNIQEVISWSDNRWSLGHVYKKMGFLLDGKLPPDYSYFDYNHRKTRLSKQSQKKSSVKCPPGLTELAWANQRGLHRIWDCGKIRWKWTKPN